MLGKKVFASLAIGAGMVGVVTVSNQEREIAVASKLGIFLLYPTLIFPSGIVMNSLTSLANEYFTPYAFKKQVQENPFRMKNYLFNKRFMAFDILVNQTVYAMVLAFAAFPLFRWIESEASVRYRPAKQQVISKKQLTGADWLLIAKVRWTITLAKIANEFYFGWREMKGAALKNRPTLVNVGLSLFWQGALLQTFLDLRPAAPITPNLTNN